MASKSNKEIESFKYRNEIETMSRLRGYKVDNLYSDEINQKVETDINNQYNPNTTISHEDMNKYTFSTTIDHGDYKEQHLNDYYINIEDNTLLSSQIQDNDKIEWDEYFMNVAILTSLRSSDMNTKVGSVLISPSNKIIGTGYNGIPKNLEHSIFPTTNDKSLPYNETKYAYVAHAELNAILNSTVFDLSNSKLYCTLFPCNECSKVIVQKGISEIIYLSDKYHDNPEYIASRKLLESANIIYRQYNGKLLINSIS